MNTDRGTLVRWLREAFVLPKESQERTRKPKKQAKRQKAAAKACEGKVQHALRSSAEREANRLGRSYQAYPCLSCKGWHVGRTR